MKPDLDAIRARCEAATSGPWCVSTLTYPNGTTVVESITGVSEPQWSDYGEGEGEWFTDRLTLVETDAGHYGPTMPDAQFIAAARTDIPALLAHIDTLEHMLAEERENVDTLRAAVEHAEQRFVDEYDARKAAEREIDELKARITTLEAMR